MREGFGISFKICLYGKMVWFLNPVFDKRNSNEKLSWSIIFQRDKGLDQEERYT